MRPCSFSLPRPTFKAEGVGGCSICQNLARCESVPRLATHSLPPPPQARSLEKRKSAAERKTTTVRCIGKEKKKAIWKVCNPFHSKFPSRLFCNGIVPYKKEIYSLCAPKKKFFPEAAAEASQSSSSPSSVGRSVASFPANLVTERKSSCKN